MHHFCGGLVYCCIVTHKMFLREAISLKTFEHFVWCPEYSMCFLFVPVSLFNMPHLQVNLYRKRIYLPVFYVPASMYAKCNMFPSTGPHFTCVRHSAQHIGMNIQHRCTNRFTRKSRGNSVEWVID